MSKLTDALRQKFGSPQEAIEALGIDPATILEGEDTKMTTRFRAARTARRLGRDQEEEGRQDLQEMLDEGAPADEIVAALVEGCPDDQRQALHEALGELGEDMRFGRRSPRQWAADRLERRRLGRDLRPRRLGRDEPEPFEGRPRPGGSMDPISGGRLYDPERDGANTGRSGAMDRRLAYDTSPQATFARMFPNAAKTERF